MAEDPGGAAQMGEPLSISTSARGVMTVLLNRPERGNALGQQMLSGLMAALETARTDARIRILLLRGAGRHFCSGADLAERGASSANRVALPDVLAAVDVLPKPTVAVVQGGCVGGGLALATCCDAVLAMENAFFSVPELRLGLVPTALMPFFVRALGPRALRRYGLSGERIAAAAALRLGIVGAVLEEGKADAEVEALLDALLHSAPGAVREFKRRLGIYGTLPPADTQPGDAELEAERQEGVASFREKRKPAWYVPPA